MGTSPGFSFYSAVACELTRLQAATSKPHLISSVLLATGTIRGVAD